MEQDHSLSEMQAYRTILDCLHDPAFLFCGADLVLQNHCAYRAESVIAELRRRDALHPGLSTCIGEWQLTGRQCGEFLLLLAESIQEKTSFAQTAAGALRVPLANLYGALTALSHDLEEKENSTYQKLTAEMERSVYRLIRAASNLETVAAGEVTVQLAPLEVGALMQSICEKARCGAQACGQTLQFAAPGRPLWIYGDAQQLERAAMNLLSNAFRFAPAGSQIKVRVTHFSGFAMVTVINPVAELPPPPQFTMSAGTGLTVARLIANAHGGVLMQETTAEHFTVCLTLAMNSHSTSECVMATPVLDYGGGFNHYLLELSDVLPIEYYDSRGL